MTLYWYGTWYYVVFKHRNDEYGQYSSEIHEKINFYRKIRIYFLLTKYFMYLLTVYYVNANPILREKIVVQIGTIHMKHVHC